MNGGIAWRAPVPGLRQQVSGQLVFTSALELSDGGFVVAGNDIYSRYLVRLDSAGRYLWKASGALAVSSPFGLWETSDGLVNLWKDIAQNPVGEDELEMFASRYDMQGRVTASLSSGRGNLNNWDRTANGDFLYTKSVKSAGDSIKWVTGRMGFSGDSNWTFDPGRLSRCGIYALSGGNSLVVGRLDGQFYSPINYGDTLELFKLDSRGKRVWATEILPGNFPELHTFLETDWYATAESPSGNLLIAGTTYPVVNGNRKDGVAVMAVSKDGKFLGMRTQLIEPLGMDADKHGKALVDGITATGDGFRLKLNGEQSQGLLDVTASGEFTGGWIRTPTVFADTHFETSEPMGFAYKAPSFIGVGNMQDLWFSLGGKPNVYFPGGYGYPVLLVSDQTQWKAIPLIDLGDTLMVSLTGEVSEEGPSYYMTSASRVSFLLSTRDGGALIGGNMWVRNGQDTTLLAAVKLAPGFEVGLRPVGAKIRSAPRFPDFEIDALGRRRQHPAPGHSGQTRLFPWRAGKGPEN